jgi:hypothetical protein
MNTDQHKGYNEHRRQFAFLRNTLLNERRTIMKITIVRKEIHQLEKELTILLIP